MKKIPKILVLGYGRHGKDTFTELILQHFNYNNQLMFCSASMLASELFIFDKLKNIYGYRTPLECFDDRYNHRVEWHNLINAENNKNRSSLTIKVLKKSDFYNGMRDPIDFQHTKSLFDIIVWIDASERLPIESNESCQLDKSVADVILENNGTRKQFEAKVMAFGKVVYGLKPCNSDIEEIESKMDEDKKKSSITICEWKRINNGSMGCDCYEYSTTCKANYDTIELDKLKPKYCLNCGKKIIYSATKK